MSNVRPPSAPRATSGKVRCTSYRRRMRSLRVAPFPSASGVEPYYSEKRLLSTDRQSLNHTNTSAARPSGSPRLPGAKDAASPSSDAINAKSLLVLRQQGFARVARLRQALCRQAHSRSLRYWELRLASCEPVLHTLESMKGAALLPLFGSTAQCQQAIAELLLRVRGPNPSIERTCPSRLRLLAPAAHVKR